MGCLKVDEYIKRTASTNETQLLFQELETHVKSRQWLRGRTNCDRVIRACNHQLSVGSLDPDHISQLVKLVELALHGFDIFTVTQTSPLYMEKILFHIVKNLRPLQVHSLSSHVAALLYARLASTQQDDNYYILVLSCFTTLWNGLADAAILNPRDKLRYQFQALRFLLLSETKSDTPSISKAPVYAENAISEFSRSCDATSEDVAFFLVQEMHTFLPRCWACGQDCLDDESKHSIITSRVFTLLEMVLVIIKMLCQAGHYSPASAFLNVIRSKIKNVGISQAAALELGKSAILISTVTAPEKVEQVLEKCAMTLRTLPHDVDDREAHCVLEGCGLVMWAVKSSHTKGLGGPVLLSCFSFLKEHQNQIIRIRQKSTTIQSGCSRLHETLCFSFYQGFQFVNNSLVESQLEDGDTLAKVMLCCQDLARRMMIELHTLSNDTLLVKAVLAVSNLARGLYKWSLYDQAFTLVEILCQDLGKTCPASLPVDRLNQLFSLAVQASRKAGHLERALDWVVLWLKALGDKFKLHMAEPISLWVKAKMDASYNSEEEIRLRTIRDGFGPGTLEEDVMLCLLDEELRAYKEEQSDTLHEQYNTLCDLLDICHEESSHTYLRAVYLCEMAQVVCFQDFTEQTDCTPVDFTHEALRLLEEEPETPENADQLKDAKAHALLWIYICTLENNLQKATERDMKLQEMRRQSPCEQNPGGTNDLDYEDKQKNKDNILLYDDLHFSLAAHNKLCQPLEKALSEWAAFLHTPVLPSVKNPKQTCISIELTASLFRLMGKPLKSLEAYQLAIKLYRQLANTQGVSRSLCLSASLLLELGSTELALGQIEQAEKNTSDGTTEDLSTLSLLLILLKAQYCYSTGQVDRGVEYLCEVLKETNEQRCSKGWYLLRAQALQICSSYLSLDTTSLPQIQRRCITQLGFKSPDFALHESLKLLNRLLLTLVGKDLYGTTINVSGVRGKRHNIEFKWRLLSELLNCSMKMIVMRTNCGAINDARLQCQEALKLATKLQVPSYCAELLVVKAELELMQGEREETGFDLDKVRNLLEHCTDFPDTNCKSKVKFKPRKGRPMQKVMSPSPVLKDDLKEILSTRWTVKEPILQDEGSSPRLKTVPRRWLSCLTHKFHCECPCCSEPLLSRIAARWAAAQAIFLQLDPSDSKVGFKLYLVTLVRCKTITAKLETKLAELFLMPLPIKSSPKPSLMQDVVGRVYLHMAFSSLEPGHRRFYSIWKVLKAGLAFAESVPSPELRTLTAKLLAIKALASLVAMCAKKDCRIEELFSEVWTWKAPTHLNELKWDNKTTLHQPSLKEPKSVSVSKKKKPTNIKVDEPKSHQTRTTVKEKGLVPKTPVMVSMTPVGKSKFSARELGAFDFNTIDSTLPYTPVQKAKAPKSVQKTQRTACKLQFQVFDEFLPGQDRAQIVPAAPRRTKKSRFQVEFSDESDSENNTLKEPIKKNPKKRATPRQAALQNKAVSVTPAEKILPTRQTRRKKTVALPRDTSSEDESLICKPATRRGRPRNVASNGVELEDWPEKMRAIEEESDEILDLSVEYLRTSDTETKDCPASEIEFEVLRRDWFCGLESGDLLDQRGGCKVKGSQTHLPHSDEKTDYLSLADVQTLLRSAWVTLQHFPAPNVFPTVCAFLALSTGQQDPMTTAMLHTQSLGITSRHRTIRYLASCVLKLKKASNELAAQMDHLTLDDSSNITTGQRLSQLESIFAFPSADSSTFPESHCQQFLEQIQQIPSGVTVCVMSVIGVKSQEMGESILLSRLQRGSAPVTVHIPTSTERRSIRGLVQEMDSILVEQKTLNCVSEKAQWWWGRRDLDSRVEQLVKEMEHLLGCWKSLLLPLTSDPKLSPQVERLCKTLCANKVTASEEMLKALLSATPVLSQKDWKRFTLGVCPHWDDKCEQLLQSSVVQLTDRKEPCGHVVLILDKFLQKLPWESISILRSRSVSRMPSLESLVGLSFQKKSDPESILKNGVDRKNTFYLLDPDKNLGSTQNRFKAWFSSQPNWDGVCGSAPEAGQLEEAVATKDLYIFMGHGAGARFLDSHAVLKRPIRAASLLIGCSSAALAVRGDQEGQGIILNYLIAGCPFLLGNLWDVTDRDIDRFAQALLESWFSSKPGSALLDYIGPSRQATNLKYLIGAAPVVYGLPIYLQ
ncbi:separin isoform X1 [Nerophis ophidion]|uniref:separin isoform X1 n=1 Tax=Nerophis ophidion TaxID=159077 RepID=UPI002ADF0CB7|nr:separin isoform X1 [Nerophis ophidion]